ncbi:4'-phosphopantetheinyl transferase family protein [Streptomyces sp. NPDC020801]|uniref:4'-phosphopantetheinyl transferase family protein n=1 Tax=unclassified Streptomyces TaxID=2593676 RepID=UPI0037A1EBFF
METVFPVLAPGRVHRWGGATLVVARRAVLDRVPSWSPLPMLSRAEQDLFHALPPRRQGEWGAGRLLAKCLVADAAVMPVTEIEILPRADGSPEVSVGGGPVAVYQISISHTAHHVAVALASGAVGVDVCETGAAAAVRRAADHVLTEEERPVIPDRPEFLCAAWALKEAAIKADRDSLFGEAPRRIRILGLTPPALDGRRRAEVRRTGTAVLALVLAAEATPLEDVETLDRVVTKPLN